MGSGSWRRPRLLVPVWAIAVAVVPVLPAVVDRGHGRRNRGGSRVADLTHRLRRTIPTFTRDPPSDEGGAEIDTSGVFAKRRTINVCVPISTAAKR